jgi:hypothetical protein
MVANVSTNPTEYSNLFKTGCRAFALVQVSRFAAVWILAVFELRL